MDYSDISGRLADECIIRGNPKEFMGPAVVAFLDVLGMSDALAQSWGNTRDSSLHRLLRIKSGIPIEDQNSATFSLWDHVTNRNLEQFLSITRTLSDSVVTMIALPPSPSHCNNQQFCLAVYAVLISARFIWQQSLREGFTVRGAVELGDMYWDEKEFIGPALVQAHRLEHRFARNSRVLIGPILALRIAEYHQVDPNWDTPLNSLYVSEDGAIAINPHFLIEQDSIHILSLTVLSFPN